MGVLISFGIVLMISIVIGLVTRWLRNIQQAEEYRRAEARAASRNRSSRDDNTDEAPRAQRNNPNTDMERFLEEINKLRSRSGTGGTVPQARPVATPVAQPAIPVVTPTRRHTTMQDSLPSPPPVVTAPIQLDSLPGVTYSPVLLSMTTSKPLATAISMPAPLAVAKPVSTDAVQPDRRKKSELMTNFHALLRSGKGPALAIMVQEVLGPPKCRQQGQGHTDQPPQPAS
jgi:hypothetical protein